jgi:hypothetical protein
MTPVAPSDQELPRVLVERGWQQGALFRAPGISVCQMHINDNNTISPCFVVRHSEIQPDDYLVVATHTCDLLAPLVDEPVIEALLCRVVSDQGWRATISKSLRYFEVDHEKGLVAYASLRAQLSKKILLQLTPEPWPDTPFRLRRFSTWLGHRFSRPAIPDEVVAGFQRPAGIVLEYFRKKQVDDFLAFMEAVGQIRIGIDERPAPPFDVRVVLLSFLRTLSKSQADAIERVMKEIEGKADSTLVRVHPHRLLTPDKMSLAEYLDTKPVYFDYLTYRGDEVVGAEPPPLH